MAIAAYELHVDGCETALRVRLVRGEERVHGPHRFEVTTDAVGADDERVRLDIEALLAQKAELVLVDASASRRVHGIVDAIEEVGAGYLFVLVPRVAVLADRVDHRVFVDQDTVAIVRAVLAEHGLEVDVRVTRTLPKRPQCVQAFEDDLAFVSRLCAEEGILWYVDDEGESDVVVLADHAAAYAPIAGGDELPFGEGDAAGLDGEASIFGVKLTRSAVVGRVALRDFAFEAPTVDLSVAAGDGPLEHFEFPGGYSDPSAGQALATIRLEEEGARKIVLSGRTTCRRLVPGATFRLRGGPRDDLDRTWLVLEVSHEGGDFGARATPEGRRYEANFVAVPGTHAHRPQRGDAHTRKPTLGGVQTATVSGPPGAEIHTEAHGRIKAHLRWDRVRPNDDTSSQWLRPVHAPTSGGFLLPRIGWEVLLGFGRASADEPFELGRVYNAAAPPPEALPAGKVRSAFGTLTTPGGGSGNLLRMDDTAGNEGMTLGASKDFNERTENDKVVNIKGDDVHTVGSNRTETVGILKTETVDVLQSYTVSATRDVTTVGRLTISAASESVLVGGLRLFQVGGDYETQAAVLGRTVGGLKAETAIQEVNRHVTGASSVMVGGSWTEIGGLSASTSVLGASSLAVGGPMSIQAKSYSLKASTLKETLASRTIQAAGKRREGIKGAAKYSIGGSLSLHGSAVVFKADSKITIQASGATITVTPSSINIDGAFDASDASVVTGDETND